MSEYFFYTGTQPCICDKEYPKYVHSVTECKDMTVSEEEADQIFREVVEVVRRSKGSNPSSPYNKDLEEEGLVNALSGPVRELVGTVSPETDFLIDSSDDSLVRGLDDIRMGFLLREREAREKRADVDDDPLTLANVMDSLRVQGAQMRKLFLAKRFQLLLGTLREYDEMKRGIVQKRVERLSDVGLSTPTVAPGVSPTGAVEIQRQEDEFDETLLKRMEVVRQEILEEFEETSRDISDDRVIVLREFKDRNAPPLQIVVSPEEANSLPLDPKPRDPRTNVTFGREQMLVDDLISAISEIDKMTGLQSLKRSLAKQVVSTIASMEDAQFNRHINILLFGQPGTGKTASAQKIGNVYRALGVLPKRGEADFASNSYGRSRLVGAFEGQTSIKTRQAFAACLGGVLFIDEFYTLRSGDRDQVGQEAIDTIVEESEKFKGKVLIIGAGYEDRIRANILAANEGMVSRFPQKWRLPSYGSAQLLQIVGIARQAEMFIGADMRRGGSKANDILRQLIERAWAKNMFEDTNARGALNLRTAVLGERTVRVFRGLVGQRGRGVANFDVPVQPVDVYVGFVQWALSEKNVHVYYVDEMTRATVEGSRVARSGKKRSFKS